MAESTEVKIQMKFLFFEGGRPSQTPGGAALCLWPSAVCAPYPPRAERVLRPPPAVLSLYYTRRFNSLVLSFILKKNGSFILFVWSDGRTAIPFIRWAQMSFEKPTQVESV